MTPVQPDLTLIRNSIVFQHGEPVLQVTVIPHAPMNGIVGLRNGSLLIKVAAAPEDGKANKAVLDILANAVGLAPSKLEIIRGNHSRHKSIRVPPEIISKL